MTEERLRNEVAYDTIVRLFRKACDDGVISKEEMERLNREADRRFKPIVPDFVLDEA